MSDRPLTLGQVIERLARLSPDLLCKPAFGEPDSWRGDYASIAFEPRESATVREMLSCARAADGATFTGYKGGNYRMTLNTQCYVAEYGEYNGEEDDALSIANYPWLCTERDDELVRLRARVAELEAALADERKHADELAAALEALRYDETNCWCSSRCDVPRQCGCARRLLKSHAARRAKEAAE